MADLSKVLEQLYGSTQQAEPAPQEPTGEHPSPQSAEPERPERFSSSRAPEWASDERLDAAFARWGENSQSEGDQPHRPRGRAERDPISGDSGGFEDEEATADMITAPVPVVRMGAAPWQRGDDDILPSTRPGRRRKSVVLGIGRRSHH